MLPSILTDRPVLERKFLDRKFASRWVLLSEGDEGGMSMTGYMLFCQLDFILVGCSINFIIHDF